MLCRGGASAGGVTMRLLTLQSSGSKEGPGRWAARQSMRPGSIAGDHENNQERELTRGPLYYEQHCPQNPQFGH